MKRTHAIALASASLAAIGTAGISGVLAAGAADDTTTTATTTTPQGDMGRGPGGPGFGHRGPGGPGGPGRGHHGPRPLTDDQISQIAGKLGITGDALKTAMDKVKPQRPAGDDGDRRGHGPDGLAADLAKELGVDSADVLKILEANRPERPATPPAPGEAPPKPNLSKLVTALASGLNKDEATVQAALDKLRAAHEAEHADRGPGKMFDALATELGKSSADVRKAFEDVLGVPPAKPASAQAAAKQRAAAKAAAKKRAAARAAAKKRAAAAKAAAKKKSAG